MLSLGGRGAKPPAVARSLTAEADGTGLQAEIRELVERVVGANLGRGPRVRTYLNSDVVTLVVEDALTDGERRLVREGLSDSVLSTRKALQRTMREELKAGLERVTGGEVWFSGNQMTPAIAIEVLVLEGGRAPARRCETSMAR
jgi:uncharacterized protein YbcI